MARASVAAAPVAPPWHGIDTVLLDMDGTLIDLSYDTYVWQTVVPKRFGARLGIGPERAAVVLYGEDPGAAVGLEFYDLDRWARDTGLDIDAIIEELAPLIRYRPNAARFVAAVRESGRRAVIATNAHPRSVALKHRVTGLLDTVDGCVTSHEIGAPKESPAYWRALGAMLEDERPFDPSSALLIDDNQLALRAAARTGIGHLLCVERPDSTACGRTDLPFAAVRDFAEIMP